MMTNLFVSIPVTVFVVWCISFLIKKFTKHEIKIYLLRTLTCFVFIGAAEGFFNADYHSLLWIAALACIWFGFQTIRKSPSFVFGLVSLVVTIAASYYAYTMVYGLFLGSHWSWGGVLFILIAMFSFYFIFPFFNSSNGSYTSSSSSRAGSSGNNRNEDSSADRNKQFEDNARRQSASSRMYDVRAEIDRKKNEISSLNREISNTKTQMETAARRNIDSSYPESSQRADISMAESYINDYISNIRSLESEILSLEREAKEFEREANS